MSNGRRGVGQPRSPANIQTHRHIETSLEPPAQGTALGGGLCSRSSAGVPLRCAPQLCPIWKGMQENESPSHWDLWFRGLHQGDLLTLLSSAPCSGCCSGSNASGKHLRTTIPSSQRGKPRPSKHTQKCFARLQLGVQHCSSLTAPVWFSNSTLSPGSQKTLLQPTVWQEIGKTKSTSMLIHQPWVLAGSPAGPEELCISAVHGGAETRANLGG